MNSLVSPLLLSALLVLLASAAGRQMLRWVGISSQTSLERWVYSTPLGMGVIAYTILALGLLGALSPVPVFAALVLLAAAAWRGWSEICAEVLANLGRRPAASVEEPTNAGVERSSPVSRISLAGSEQPISAVADPRDLSPTSDSDRPARGADDAVPGLQRLIAGAILVSLLAIALINCFVPPGAHEWDALSYHLAAPKVYLEHHRIVYLPTDHHSNFPFLVEMLFTLGLLFSGFALANLIHLTLAVFCIMAIWAIARRHFASGTAAIAALTFASAPIVVWEAGASYIEMGLTLFILLAVGALLDFRQSRCVRWLWLAGILLGFALSVKALALVPFGLTAFFLLAEKPRLRDWAAFAGLAVLAGCPFYVKSWVWTGNPVYPFGYAILGGRDWDAQIAAATTKEQRSFGQGAMRTSVQDDLAWVRADDETGPVRGAAASVAAQAAARARNVILAPFDLVAIPHIFYNYNDPGVRSHLGFLFLALLPAAALAGASRASKWIAALLALWFAAWSQSMQYVRYLIPLLPLAGLIGGEGSRRLASMRPKFGLAVWSAVLLQAAVTLWAFVPQVPAQVARAANPEERERFLRTAVNVYSAEQWINRNAPQDAGVVLFEDTRGFYLDRPYLWGNGLNSLYIPYRRFLSAREMVDWFLDNGIRYAIINLQFAPMRSSQRAEDQFREAIANGAAPGLAMEWYDPKQATAERASALHSEYGWRALLGDAMTSGAAVPIPDASSHGAVVLEFRASRAGAAS